MPHNDTCDLRTGDLVRLWSGSPEMTVEGYSGDGLVVCLWYDDGRRDFRREAFRTACLEMIPRD